MNTLPETDHRAPFCLPSATELLVLDRRDFNVYGQARVLSKQEIVLHTFARAVVIGVGLGFALAIFLFIAQNDLAHQALNTTGLLLFASQEVAS